MDDHRRRSIFISPNDIPDMYKPHPGVLNGVAGDERARIISELSELITDLGDTLEEACDSMRDLEKGLNRILFGERPNPFERIERDVLPG